MRDVTYYFDRQFAVLGVVATIFAIFYGAWWSNIVVLLDSQANQHNSTLLVSVKDPPPQIVGIDSMVVSVANAAPSKVNVDELRAWLADWAAPSALAQVILLGLYLLVISYFVRSRQATVLRRVIGFGVIFVVGLMLILVVSSLLDVARNRFQVEDHTLALGRGLLSGFVIVAWVFVFVSSGLSKLEDIANRIRLSITVKLEKGS